jgi:hypothetical protein
MKGSFKRISYEDLLPDPFQRIRRVSCFSGLLFSSPPESAAASTAAGPPSRQKVLVRDPLKRPFHRKKRTPLGNVRRENCDLLSRREVFFFGATKSQKKSVTPKIRKFRLSWGSKRYAIQHETENHAALLTGTGDFVKIPKIGAIHKKKR